MNERPTAIVLIGMPSCGKSVLGRLLAKRLGYRFVDTDDVIREQTGCALQDILDRDGLSGFRRREEDAICSVDGGHAVIATGGSVVYSDRAMRHLREIGRVIYLSISYDTLVRRVGDPHARGVAIPDGFSLRELYDQRVPLYEKYADAILPESDDESPAASLTRLMNLLAEQGKSCF